MMSAKTKSCRVSRVIVVCYLQHSYRSYPVLIYSRQRQDISCWMWRGIFDTWRLEMTSTRVCSTSLCQTVCNMVMVNVCFSLDCLQCHYHVAHTHIYIHICIHIQYWNMFFRCIIQQVWSNWDTIDTHTHIYIYTHTRIHFYVIWTLDIVSRHRYVHTFRYMYTYICVYIICVYILYLHTW